MKRLEKILFASAVVGVMWYAHERYELEKVGTVRNLAAVGQILVTPYRPDAKIGDWIQFHATLNGVDVTEFCEWTSTDPSKIAIDSHGLAYIREQGQASVWCNIR